MPGAVVADIGGTGSRFSLTPDGHALGATREFRNRDFDSFEAVLAAGLDALGERPEKALFAIAGPVRDNAVYMTNLGWSIDGNALASRFSLKEVRVLNDFEALAWATLELDEGGLLKIGDGMALPRAPRGVIGPGTGLGVSSLVPAGESWVAVAGEGGHVTMAAANAEEAELIAAATSEFGHCSAERLISGPGLAWLYRQLGGEGLEPAEITAAAKAGDVRANAAVDTMARMLGTVASDLALTIGAAGGIYIGGGILPGIRDLFLRTGFRERFEDKGRFRGYLRAIPTWLITAPHAALRGLAACSRQ